MGDTIRRRSTRLYIPGGQFGPETTPFWSPILDQNMAPPVLPGLFGLGGGWDLWGREHFGRVELPDTLDHPPPFVLTG